MKKIRITLGEIEVEAELNDSAIAKKIWQVLPIKATANLWGEEIYFSIPVEAVAENPQQVVGIGDLGYWPPGKAFCLFFGKTPVSTNEEIRPASPVEIVGKFFGDPKLLNKISSGESVLIKKESCS